MSASLPNSSVPPSASGHIVLAAAMLCHLLLQALSPAQKQAATVATQTSPHLLHSALLPSASGRGSAADAHSKPRPKRARAAREVQALQVSFHFVMHAPRTHAFFPGGVGEGAVCFKLQQTSGLLAKAAVVCLQPVQQWCSTVAMQVTRCSRCLTLRKMLIFAYVVLTDMHEQCLMPLPAHRPVLKDPG